MITLNTVNRLIDNYIKIIETTKSYGYVNLRFYYSGMDDADTLIVLASYDPIQHTNFGDVDEALTEILGTKVVLASEASCFASDLVKKEAENAPLSDMGKTIHYFCDLLIPASGENVPSKEVHQLALQRWSEQPHLTMVQPLQPVSSFIPTSSPLFYQKKSRAKNSPKRKEPELTLPLDEILKLLKNHVD